MIKRILIVVGLFFTCAWAQVADKEVERWEKEWSVKTIPGFLDMTKSTKWLPVHSDFTEKKNNNIYQERINSLFKELKGITYEFFESDENESVESVQHLFALEEKLILSGGYKNKLLAIYVVNIAAVKITQVVTRDPETTSDIRVLLEKRNSKVTFDPLELMQSYSVEDVKFDGKVEQLIELLKLEREKEEPSYLLSVFKTLEKSIPMTSPDDLFDMDNLFEPANVYSFTLMYSISEALMRSTCLGLLKFIEKGGEIDKLKEGGSLYLSEVMGDSIDDFVLPYFNQKSLNPDGFLQLYYYRESEDAKRALSGVWNLKQ